MQRRSVRVAARGAVCATAEQHLLIKYGKETAPPIDPLDATERTIRRGSPSTKNGRYPAVSSRSTAKNVREHAEYLPHVNGGPELRLCQVEPRAERCFLGNDARRHRPLPAPSKPWFDRLGPCHDS